MTTNFAYIKNDYNRCNALSTPVPNEPFVGQVTGWHFIPNNRWKDYLNHAQWFDLTCNHEAFRIKEINCSVMNLIPLTDQLAIQQNTTFMSFNNTIYALAYDDTCYETTCSMMKTEQESKVYYREGMSVDPATGNISEKQYLPEYLHLVPSISRTSGSGIPTKMPGYFWDPLTRATTLMELRPGKNSINFSWHCSPEDEHLWWSLNSGFITQYNSAASGRRTWINRNGPGASKFDNSWITPFNYAAFDPAYNKYPTTNPNNMAASSQLFSTRSEIWASQNTYKKPIRNWFIKMLPILDSNKALLKHEGMVCIVKKITLEVEPRKSAVNYPRLPYSWASVTNMESNMDTQYTLGIPKVDMTGKHMMNSDSDSTLDSWPYMLDVQPAQQNEKNKKQKTVAEPKPCKPNV